MAETTRDLRVDLALSDVELDALERALLKARATELSEVRRRDVRLTAGYGDSTNRDVMGDEASAAQLRHDVISRLLDAIRATRAG
jgi:hypothetical protein